jgi:hypothetical protein
MKYGVLFSSEFARKREMLTGLKECYPDKKKASRH